MVLQRIDISTTICKVVLNSKIYIFSYICIIPYVSPYVNINKNKCSIFVLYMTLDAMSTPITNHNPITTDQDP